MLHETALGSPPFGHSAHLHTHTVFPRVRESPGRHALILSVSVTAREFVGWRMSCGNTGTSTPCTRRGISGEATVEDVRVAEEKSGRLTMGLGVVMTRQDLVSSFLLRVLVVVPGHGGG